MKDRRYTSLSGLNLCAILLWIIWKGRIRQDSNGGQLEFITNESWVHLKYTEYIWKLLFKSDQHSEFIHKKVREWLICRFNLLINFCHRCIIQTNTTLPFFKYKQLLMFSHDGTVSNPSACWYHLILVFFKPTICFLERC